MTTEYEQMLDPRRQLVVTELTALVKQRYPTATFATGPSEGDRDVTHITATVDTDDPDEVTDLVIDRMLELTIDEGILVSVIPIRTPERVAKLVREQRAGWPRPAAPASLPAIAPQERAGGRPLVWTARRSRCRLDLGR